MRITSYILILSMYRDYCQRQEGQYHTRWWCVFVCGGGMPGSFATRSRWSPHIVVNHPADRTVLHSAPFAFVLEDCTHRCEPTRTFSIFEYRPIFSFVRSFCHHDPLSSLHNVRRRVRVSRLDARSR